MSKCAKRRYRDEVSAKLAIASIGRKSDRETVPARAYRCPDCAGWHLTSRP